MRIRAFQEGSKTCSPFPVFKQMPCPLLVSVPRMDPSSEWCFRTVTDVGRVNIFSNYGLPDSAGTIPARGPEDIVVRKFREKDFLGAKKFVLKAQNLHPGLEGLSQMLTIPDVYISAEKKVSGEVDWYGILGSIGADGAFRLVSEAWSSLSDKGKRLSYNQKMDAKGSQQKTPSQNGAPSASASANGVHNFTSGVASNARTHSNANRPSPTSVPSPSHRRTDTFWTVCNRCKTQYEYLRIYLNRTQAHHVQFW
ncbi:hypothetical protein PVL29_005997 [Vitis rotundifolia]|uniref:Zinc beta-ribbon domain-containing protein n=1 Tax=Vitis rotundifolia TaxID=103349 RepID=A0AA39A404_VITRO|nr:hypothetical protein PVL29_005997 [Vitis rotundifolia]